MKIFGMKYFSVLKIGSENIPHLADTALSLTDSTAGVETVFVYQKYHRLSRRVKMPPFKILLTEKFPFEENFRQFYESKTFRPC